jgi:hypothetical protein
MTETQLAQQQAAINKVESLELVSIFLRLYSTVSVAL